ncbi:MauE/DoxX family redox-associated membrane protein [Chryseobacterium sp. S-02]|uniref:MauE/DoxX family redox-associated membrane protein n=1 Tax=Chryseobacterium sp. S-02 TaxID=3404064 RepID=UPI003CF5F32C
MKSFKTIFIKGVSYFFILLFIYASVSKLLDFENFQVQLAQSPMLGAYAGIVSLLVIGVELVIVYLLVIRKFRITGLYAALGIMSAFTMYIYLILNYSDSIPCSCGGILEKMDWNQHLMFNICCVLLLIVAIIFNGFTNRIKLMSRLALSTILPLLSVVLLFDINVDEHRGSFKRYVIEPLTMECQILKFPMNNYYFAGSYGDSLFLANRKTPLLLSTITPDYNSIKLDTIRLDNYKYDFVSVTINVLYPYFSVSDGKVPVIFEGKFPTLMAYETGINRLYFSRFYMIEPQKYVFKTMLVKTKESELGILNTAKKEYQIFPDVLQKKTDGVFDTDGDMAIDHYNKKIIYTHFYLNEMITADFNFHNIQRNRTIDSLSHIAIETKTLKNGQQKLLRSPSVINRAQTLYDNKFYNVSNIRGKDESLKVSRNNFIIDVYNNQTKQYLYSFYIRNHDKDKIRGILCTKHYFYVLSGNKISRYTFK